MTRIFATKRGVILAALLGTLPLGCASQPPVSRGLAVERVEGDWLNPKGIAVSRFSNGKFVTVERRSGKRLAEGTYILAGEQLDISMLSFVRRKRMQVRCKLDGDARLQCVNQLGHGFQLTKAQRGRQAT